MPTPKPPTPTSTRALFQNLGSGIRWLAKAQPTTPTYDSDAAFGKQVDGLIAAALKAVAPGRQTSAQMRSQQHAARQAASRKLARLVKRLPPVAT